MNSEFVASLTKVTGFDTLTTKAELTKNELRILTVLAKKRGEIVSRDEIMEELWESHLFVDDNTLTVNMTRLKGKLEEIDVKGAIVTKRGMGYQLV